jgi:hypothetical protein
MLEECIGLSSQFCFVDLVFQISGSGSLTPFEDTLFAAFTSTLNVTVLCSFGLGGRFHMAQTCSLEGFYIRVETLSRQVPYKSKFGGPQHNFFGCSLLYV